MKNDVVIDVQNITKEYYLFKNEKEKLLYFLGFNKNIEKKIALNNISFVIKRGETVAIVGKNGAGKSTLLKMLTGVVYPDNGYIKTNGRVGALLELQAGLSKELTGRENIYLRLNILGISKEESNKLINRIIDFSELGKYIDQPVKNYSSGMKARLGFAINISIKPEILIIDEALSVGDAKFKEKCKKVIDELIKENVTILVVNHSNKNLKDICKRGILLQNSMKIFDGDIDNCLKIYKELN